MAGRSRAEWSKQRHAWAWALQQAAQECGKDSKMYKILGSVAWGRFDGEAQPQEPKDNIIFGAGYLQGARSVALAAGREFRLPGTIHLENIHSRLTREES